MPRILLNRIGDDSLAKLEAAATLRFREARKLQDRGERLGALYLYGYTIEMRLKAAYYRLAGLGDNDDLSQRSAPGSQSPRNAAEAQIRALPGLNLAGSVGHHLEGWVRLLVRTRSSHLVVAPFATVFEKQLSDHVQSAARQWKEYLRYRANRPYDEELSDVTDAARWIGRNYHQL
jgi:hypothetical protein